MGRPEWEVRRYQSGALPFTVEAYVDTYHGPAWVKRQLRGRSGWLQVSRARLTTDISDWSATIVAGITEDGDRLGKMTANAFLAMRTSEPQTCFDDPPTELADFSEMLFWDFLGRCDIRHLDMLAEVEVELAARLDAEQMRGEHVLGDAERFIAELQRRRRAPGSGEDRGAIDARISLMEDKHVAASAWLVRHLARLRDAGDAFEADVMAALENHGEVEDLYTVHWVARSQHDRFVDRGLLRELTTTGSLEGVPRRARLDKHDLWEIEEAQRQKPALTIEPTPKQKKRRAPEPRPVESETNSRREERELLAALEAWQAEKAGLDATLTEAPEPAPLTTFPPEALTPTTTVEPAAPAPGDSIDVGALIESELAEMLKDLRPL
jgi:hypothetical protein